MKFTFVYDQGEDTPRAEGPAPIPDPHKQHAQGPPPPAVRIALAAGRARTRSRQDFDRAHATLDRLWHTISTLPVDPVLSLESDEFGQDELFRPLAFRAPTSGGGA